MAKFELKRKPESATSKPESSNQKKGESSKPSKFNLKQSSKPESNQQPESKPLNRLERERLEYIEIYFYNLLQMLNEKGMLSNSEISDCIPGVIRKRNVKQQTKKGE